MWQDSHQSVSTYFILYENGHAESIHSHEAFIAQSINVFTLLDQSFVNIVFCELFIVPDILRRPVISGFTNHVWRHCINVNKEEFTVDHGPYNLSSEPINSFFFSFSIKLNIQNVFTHIIQSIKRLVSQVC